MIECDNVVCRYGEHIAVDHATLSVQKGEFVALVGPNGGGKSTLVKAMVGLCPCSEGKILIEGVTPNLFPMGFIGYVPQILSSAVVSTPLSVESGVAIGMMHGQWAWARPKGECLTRIEEAMAQCGIENLRKRLLSDLSGGERQKVFLARALAMKPHLLILDEPSTGVDQKSQEKFYQFLHALHGEGMTIVMTTHDIGVVSGWITTLVSINRHIEYSGKPECFLTHDNLDKAYGHGMHCMGFSPKIMGTCSHG